MSIRWLLDTYCGLNSVRENIVIVPVNISCDRIYESKNLATEMINGVKEDHTFTNMLRKMWNSKKDSLGDTYVKYLKPILLHEYILKSSPEIVQNRSPENFEQLALRLNTDLLVE